MPLPDALCPLPSQVMLSCPSCSAPLPPLAARCDACQRALPPLAGGGQAACARHPAFAAQAACARCGTFSCTACLGDGSHCPGCRELGAEALPWDERRKLGLWRGFWRTVLEVMLRPDSTFARAAPRGGAFDAFLFLGLASFLSLITTVLVLGMFVGGALAFFSGQAAETSDAARRFGPGEAAALGVGATAVYLLLGWGMTVVGTLVISLFDHLLVRAFGGAGGYDVTLRATALSMAPAVIGLVPMCGLYVWPVWALVARVFAYKGMHKLPTAQAVGAALIPSVAVTVILGVAYVALLVATSALGKQ